MPIYEGEGVDLENLRRRNVCKECGASLVYYLDLTKHQRYLACFRNQAHEGFEREASQYEQRGFEILTIKTRREFMEKEHGIDKARALARYEGVVSLSKDNALEILETIWPKAPYDEKLRAALLCFSYHLNPLMKHVYLIKFNKWDKEHKKVVGEEWATVLGIGATRLMASRKGTFSYTDDTPRIMTAEEQEKRFGQSYPDRIYVIVKVKDPATGAEVPGYGWWPKKDRAYGEDKGNTPFNMAANRAERQALSRLRPGEMPTSVEVMDESIADSAGERGLDVDSTATEVAEEGPGGNGVGGEPETTERVIPEFKTGPDLFTWGSKQGLAAEEMRQAAGVTNPADIKDVAAATKAVAALIPKS